MFHKWWVCLIPHGGRLFCPRSGWKCYHKATQPNQPKYQKAETGLLTTGKILPYRVLCEPLRNTVRRPYVYLA